MGYKDWHIHTHNSNDCTTIGMTIESLIARTKELGVTDFGVSDHCHARYHYEDIAASHREFKEALANHPELQGHMHFGVELSVMPEWYIHILDTGRIGPEQATIDALMIGLPDEKGSPDSTPMLLITDELRKQYEIEYVIAGVHWGMYPATLDEKGVWDNLMRQFFMAIANPHTDILAHWLWNYTHNLHPDPFYDFDKIPKTVLDDTYHALRIYNTVFEVNSCFTYNNPKHAPGFVDKYLEYAASLQDRGITLSFGSDCHHDGYAVDFPARYKFMEDHGIDTSKLWSL